MIFASVQFRPSFATSRAEVKENLRRCEGLLDQAGALGAELIAFPELAATGYSFLNENQASSVAEGRDGLTAQFMSDAARELQAYISWGFVEADGNKLYNSASMAGPDGKVLLTSRKLNLWGNDFLWASPGRFAPPVIQTDLGALSSIVCRDVKNKIPGNVPRLAASTPLFGDLKPDVVTLHVNWGKGGFPATPWMDFVADNDCTVLVANRWGVEKNSHFEQDFGHGGSTIIDKDWKVYTSGLVFNRDCVVHAIINPPGSGSTEEMTP